MCERFELSAALRIMVFWNHSFRTSHLLKINVVFSYETSRSDNPVIQSSSALRPEFRMCGVGLPFITTLPNDNIQISINSMTCKYFTLDMEN
jgi:hypothetical protein